MVMWNLQYIYRTAYNICIRFPRFEKVYFLSLWSEYREWVRFKSTKKVSFYWMVTPYNMYKYFKEFFNILKLTVNTPRNGSMPYPLLTPFFLYIPRPIHSKWDTLTIYVLDETFWEYTKSTDLIFQWWLWCEGLIIIIRTSQVKFC